MINIQPTINISINPIEKTFNLKQENDRKKQDFQVMKDLKRQKFLLERAIEKSYTVTYNELHNIDCAIDDSKKLSIDEILNTLTNISLQILKEQKNKLLNVDIYSVIVTDNKLSLSFLALENDDEELLICKHNNLILYGLDDDANYDSNYKDGTLALDTSLKASFFKRSLDPYGITIKKLITRSMDFFIAYEYEIEEQKKQQLYDLIKDEFNRRKQG